MRADAWFGLERFADARGAYQQALDSDPAFEKAHVNLAALKCRFGDQEGARKELVTACRAFLRMYRPHEAREDTVLFPALHKIVPAKRLKELGEQFEKEEDRLFGEEGFERTVDQVAAVEKQLGIYDLAGFTPR